VAARTRRPHPDGGARLPTVGSAQVIGGPTGRPGVVVVEAREAAVYCVDGEPPTWLLVIFVGIQFGAGLYEKLAIVPLWADASADQVLAAMENSGMKRAGRGLLAFRLTRGRAAGGGQPRPRVAIDHQLPALVASGKCGDDGVCGGELWVLRSPDAVLPFRCRRRDAVKNRDVRGLVDGTELRADDRRRHRMAVRLVCPIVVRYPEVDQCGCGATCVMMATERFTVKTYAESDANTRARTPSGATDARVATRNSASADGRAVPSYHCARCGLEWLG
jgi:hypothetical protein